MGELVAPRWLAGGVRLRGWWRWLPLYASPVFWDSQHPWRSVCGFSVGVFGRAVFVARR